jgi:hypothetical protein
VNVPDADTLPDRLQVPVVKTVAVEGERGLITVKRFEDAIKASGALSRRPPDPLGDGAACQL